MNLLKTCAGNPALEDAVVLLSIDVEWLLVYRALVVDLVDGGVELAGVVLGLGELLDMLGVGLLLLLLLDVETVGRLGDGSGHG